MEYWNNGFGGNVKRISLWKTIIPIFQHSTIPIPLFDNTSRLAFRIGDHDMYTPFILCRENHPLRLNTTESNRLEIGKHNNLFAPELL